MSSIIIKLDLKISVTHPIQDTDKVEVLLRHRNIEGRLFPLWSCDFLRSSIEMNPDDPSEQDEASVLAEEMYHKIREEIGFDLDVGFFNKLSDKFRTLLVDSGGMRTA